MPSRPLPTRLSGKPDRPNAAGRRDALLYRLERTRRPEDLADGVAAIGGFELYR